ncbi:hypothetical protein Tco_0665184 [Tanacetum coccineum]
MLSSKNDPKDKGKKKIEEEDESKSESDGIPQAEKKFKQLESELKRWPRKMFQRKSRKKKWNETELGKEQFANEALLKKLLIKKEQSSFMNNAAHKKIPLLIKDQKAIRNRPQQKNPIKEIKSPDEEKEVDYEILDRKYPIKEWKTESLGTKPQTDQAEHLEEINLNVVIRRSIGHEENTLIFKLRCRRFGQSTLGDFDGLLTRDDKDEVLVVHSKIGRLEESFLCEGLSRLLMLKLKLESEEDITMVLELIRFIKKLLAELEPEEKG